jgi:sialic acid synthase SpsE
LGVFAFGFVEPSTATPRHGDFERAFSSEAGQRALRDRVTLLHCTTEYPAPVGDVNLRAMETMAATFGLPVGYSDHTQGDHVSVAAVARGARVLEKHFTINRNLPGPDHQASLEPGELRELVRRVRDIEQALGDGIKRPAPSEWKNRAIARKSLVAAKAIQVGEAFTEENLACKRPGTGASPFGYWQTLGEAARRSYLADTQLPRRRRAGCLSPSFCLAPAGTVALRLMRCFLVR